MLRGCGYLQWHSWFNWIPMANLLCVFNVPAIIVLGFYPPKNLLVQIKLISFSLTTSIILNSGRIKDHGNIILDYRNLHNCQGNTNRQIMQILNLFFSTWEESTSCIKKSCPSISVLVCSGLLLRPTRSVKTFMGISSWINSCNVSDKFLQCIPTLKVIALM